MDYIEIAEKIVKDVTSRNILRRSDIGQILAESPEVISRKIRISSSSYPPSIDKGRTKFPRHAVIAWVADCLKENQ